MNTELIERIKSLKEERNAVILAHNYQPAEIQDLADLTGDSLGLSIEASKTRAEVIVFCGVRFMAETAAILSPDKTVLLPDTHAGCPLADMITAPQLEKLKLEHPGAVVVCYVNSSAEVKAASDYCCTSSNAVEVVNSLPEQCEVIFVPDQHLARHVTETTGRKMVIWPGYCRTHIMISEQDIASAKAEYPDAVVMVHPECTEPVKAIADRILSTGQMLNFVADNSAKNFIVGTEIGIIHALKKRNPNARFIPAGKNSICHNMKKITLEKLLWSLEDMQYVVEVPKEVAEKARKALERMVETLPSQE